MKSERVRQCSTPQESINELDDKEPSSLLKTSEQTLNSKEGIQITGKRQLQSESISGRWSKNEHRLFLEGRV
jgi:hypothetical protein